MRVNIFIILLILSFSAVVVAATQTQELKPTHKKNELTCTDCHGTDTPEYPVDETACVQCHEREEVTKATSKMEINPHADHEGGVDCVECHKEHKPSTSYCDTCHEYGLKTP